jgi:hypothetical protein
MARRGICEQDTLKSTAACAIPNLIKKKEKKKKCALFDIPWLAKVRKKLFRKLCGH